MAELRDYEITASGNNSGSAASGRLVENMDYRDVNDAAREMQAIIARQYRDTNGSLDTTGSANAYVLSPNQTLGSLQRGDEFTFVANFTNTAAATLNVSALGAKSIKATSGADLVAGAIQSGGMYTVVYDGTNFQIVSGEPVFETLNVFSTELVDLVDTDNPLNLGDEAGSHLALARTTVQSKANATTVAELSLNPLGGNVRVGPQSGTGSVIVYHNADEALVTTSDGVNVRSSGNDVALVLEDSSGNDLFKASTSGDDVYLDAIQSGKDVRIRVDGTVPGIDVLSSGAVSLYYNGSARISTASGGATIDAGTASALLVLTGQDGVGEGAEIRLEGGSGNGFVAIDNDSNGGVRLLVKDATEVGFVATPDAGSAMYHDNSQRIVTLSTGGQVLGTVADLNNSGAATNTQMRARNSQGGFAHYVMGDGEYRLYQTDEAAAVEKIWAVGTRDGGFGLRYNNLLRLVTTANGVDMTGTATATAFTQDGNQVTDVAQFASGYKANGSTGSIAVSFGKTFAAAPIVMITPVNDGAASGNPNSPIVLQSVTTTGFNAYLAGDIPEAFRNFNWIAIESGI